MSDGNDGVNVILATGKKAIGIKMMEKVEHAFTNRVRSKISGVKEDVDSQAVERMAWDILGQKDLFNLKNRLEKELAEVNSKMSDFDGGRCQSSSPSYMNRYDTYGNKRNRTQIEDARIAAYETMYPEVKQLEKLLSDLSWKITMCVMPSDFKEVADWLETELKNILK